MNNSMARGPLAGGKDTGTARCPRRVWPARLSPLYALPSHSTHAAPVASALCVLRAPRPFPAACHLRTPRARAPQVQKACAEAYATLKARMNFQEDSSAASATRDDDDPAAGLWRGEGLPRAETPRGLGSAASACWWIFATCSWRKKKRRRGPRQIQKRKKEERKGANTNSTQRSARSARRDWRGRAHVDALRLVRVGNEDEGGGRGAPAPSERCA